VDDLAAAELPEHSGERRVRRDAGEVDVMDEGEKFVGVMSSRVISPRSVVPCSRK